MFDADFARFRLRRSVLYVPASSDRAIAKARRLPCDAVILDLEDAVAPETKSQARGAALDALRTGGFEPRELIVRVNALSTEWGREDLEAVSRSEAAALLVPKVDDASDIMTYERMLRAAPSAMQLWAMIETPRAVLQVAQIAACSHHSRLRCLVMGSNDLASQLRMRLTPGREPMAGMLALTVAAARAHSLTVLDGVHNAFEDVTGFEAQCRQGVDFGFDGKTLIHPLQIERCNVLFSPSADSIAWATKVRAAFDEPANAGRGTLSLHGAMIERLHLAQALHILALDAAIRSRQS